MAKLRHLQDILLRIAQVDAARARVLVSKARAAGHFTTGGRGVNAPDMVPRDATTTLLLALQMDPPTEAGEAVRALRDLPFDHMKYDHGDGTFRDFGSDWLGPEGEGLQLHLPDSFDQKLPGTLGAALDALFARNDSFVNPWDKIELSKTSYDPKVILSLADADYQYQGFPVEGRRAWKFVFEPTDVAGWDGLGVWTSKTAHVYALRALRDLILEGAD